MDIGITSVADEVIILLTDVVNLKDREMTGLLCNSIIRVSNDNKACTEKVICTRFYLYKGFYFTISTGISERLATL
ncbi:hypothetical protein GCM10007190_16750 [Macrococcus hajekii]|nr:hypothetical protein GCM10007190_16750 [Macrococcus hajekii]